MRKIRELDAHAAGSFPPPAAAPVPSIGSASDATEAGPSTEEPGA
jgi:hypothetical protein